MYIGIVICLVMITFTIAILMLVTFILINFNIKTSSAVSHEVGNEFFKNHSNKIFSIMSLFMFN